MRKGIGICVLIVSLIGTTASTARERDVREVRPRERSRITRVIQEIIKVFRPAGHGDELTPPKP